MKKALLMVALVLMLGGSAWALVGDINDDGVVDILDVVLATSNYNKTGAPGWIAADINEDGIVNILDLVTITSHFGEK